MVILVNGAARGGEAASRWREVEGELRRLGVKYEAQICRSPAEMRAAANAYVDSGDECLVAAGGDGTVNALLNSVMERTELAGGPAITLGAIGLGSSNDFHKPFDRGQRIAGRPARLDCGGARRVDVGRATIRLVDGRVAVRYFILNASIGLVANGNARYNEGRWGLGVMKRYSVEAAILWAAFIAWLRLERVAVGLDMDSQGARQMHLTNLHVLKKAQFAGGMRYDTEVVADDGAFDVVWWATMGRRHVIQLLPRLYMGRSAGHSRVQSARAREIHVELGRARNMEFDGEVVQATAADIQILPRALMVCGSGIVAKPD